MNTFLFRSIVTSGRDAKINLYRHILTVQGSVFVRDFRSDLMNHIPIYSSFQISYALVFPWKGKTSDHVSVL